ncbi:response regulator [Halorussus salinus]|uniref:response regulator n=1 Tax=Halorussus salinus TaxID=1364935 RepID=UPI001091F09F|nr:response regulator [Halorussus salinus]
MEESSSITILVVDDNRDLADLYSEWLTPTYDVYTAYDGEDALNRLDETVDIVLLDRRMPRLSGKDILTKIQNRGLECQVALVTSIEPDFDILDLGFDDYLEKPTTETTLHSLVESLLARTRYSDQIQEYAALISKQATLQAAKESEELADNPDFECLQKQINELQNEVQLLIKDFTAQDFIAAFRHID